MNNRRPGGGGRPGQHKGKGSKPPSRYGGHRDDHRSSGPRPGSDSRSTSSAGFVEKWPESPRVVEKAEPLRAPMRGPFRIVIAIHRPRYRGRMERAAQLPGWDVTSLLNKQDPVGLVESSAGPPNLVIMSDDFGRQKTFGIFKAIQKYRSQGLRIVGLADIWEAMEDGSDPALLCDECHSPPYKTDDLRNTLRRIFAEIRGVPAPDPEDVDEDGENGENGEDIDTTDDD